MGRTEKRKIKGRNLVVYVPHPNPVMEALEKSTDFDGEEATAAVIDARLLTDAQRDWLASHKLTITDLLNGRYQVGDDREVHALFFKDWNDRLGLNSYGKKFFSEEPMGEAMLEKIDETMKDLGIEGFEFR